MGQCVVIGLLLTARIGNKTAITISEFQIINKVDDNIAIANCEMCKLRFSKVKGYI